MIMPPEMHGSIPIPTEISIYTMSNLRQYFPTKININQQKSVKFYWYTNLLCMIL